MKRKTEQIIKNLKQLADLNARLESARTDGAAGISADVRGLSLKITGLENEVLKLLDLPASEQHLKILRGTDPDALFAAVSAAAELWERRPIKDPLLYFFQERDYGKCDPYDVLPVMGFSATDYQVYIFDRLFMSARTYAEMDSLLAEMDSAEEAFAGLDALAGGGIAANRNIYEELRGRGLSRLDEYLLDIGRFDLPESEFTPAHWTARGEHHLRKEEYEEAVQAFTSALLSRPGDARLHLSRGEALASLGRLDPALEDFERAIEYDDDFTAAYVNRGRVWAEKGHLEGALDDFSRAIELDPDDSEAFLERGRAFALMNSHEYAVLDFSEAVEIDPGQPAVFHERGLSYHALGLKELAYNDIWKAASMGYETARDALKDLFDVDPNAEFGRLH